MKNALRTISLGVVMFLGVSCAPVLAGPSQRVVDKDTAMALKKKIRELTSNPWIADELSAIAGGTLASFVGLTPMYLLAFAAAGITKHFSYLSDVQDNAIPQLALYGGTIAGTASLWMIFHNKIKRALKSRRRAEILEILEMMESLGLDFEESEE